MADSFVNSYNEHPALTLFVLLACSMVAGWSSYTFAERVDLSRHIASSDKRFSAQVVRSDHLELAIQSALRDQKIRGIEYQIFDLQRIIDTGEGRTIDHKRLSVLKSDLNVELRGK